MNIFRNLFKKNYALVCVRSDGRFVRATIDLFKNGKLSTLFSFDNERDAIEKYNELIA